MRIIVTGANGFLGWHTRLRLSALTDHTVVAVQRENWHELPSLLTDADAVIHLAGVNRAATDSAVEFGNKKIAEDLASAIDLSGRPIRVVMAGTVQEELDNAYGNSKRAARKLLETAANKAGGHFVAVRLTNLFGEHGRPHYNSFVATFINSLITQSTPELIDREVELLHAQDAAQALIDGLEESHNSVRPYGLRSRVADVYEMLAEFHQLYYCTGEFPDLSSKFRVDLFNSYRAALFPDHYPISLTPHSDPRGRFMETVRCRGGESQSSISSTEPGVTRGDHYHLTKIERFAVIHGDARIMLRKKFTNNVVSFDVSGDKPVAIDMPTGWVHNITNTGSEILLTQFWTHELFRPEAPDTYPETVGPIHTETTR